MGRVHLLQLVLGGDPVDARRAGRRQLQVHRARHTIVTVLRQVAAGAGAAVVGVDDGQLAVVAVLHSGQPGVVLHGEVGVGGLLGEYLDLRVSAVQCNREDWGFLLIFFHQSVVQYFRLILVALEQSKFDPHFCLRNDLLRL